MSPSMSVEDIPFVEWEVFYALMKYGASDFAPWRQGEHVTMVGKTGSGKTTTAFNLLPIRRYTTILATKPIDNTLKSFGKEHDYRILKKWNPKLSVERYPNRILWPPDRGLRAAKKISQAFEDALLDIYVAGSWCLYIDELTVLCDYGFTKDVKTFLQQGRSIGLSLFSGTQRPRYVPLEAYSEATHLFFWRSSDLNNIQRLSEINYAHSEILKAVLPHLPHHELLYLNTIDGAMYRSKPPAPSPVKEVTP